MQLVFRAEFAGRGPCANAGDAAGGGGDPAQLYLGFPTLSPMGLPSMPIILPLLALCLSCGDGDPVCHKSCEHGCFGPLTSATEVLIFLYRLVVVWHYRDRMRRTMKGKRGGNMSIAARLASAALWAEGRMLPVQGNKIVVSFLRRGYGDHLKPIVEELLRRRTGLILYG